MMRYKPLFYFLGVILALWLVRCLFAGAITVYAFLAWNLFLAVIPLAIYATIPWIRQRSSGLSQKILLLTSGGAWLLFLPNAFYLLSDFMHLNPQALVNKRGDENHFAIEYARGDAIYMLDSLLLVCVTLFGAVVGGIALHQAYRYLCNRYKKSVGIAGIGLVTVLVAIGVYIGRYGRWNSWDALYRPWTVAADLIGSLSDPATLNRFCIVITTFVIFQVLCLWCMTFFIANYRKKTS